MAGYFCAHDISVIFFIYLFYWGLTEWQWLKRTGVDYVHCECMVPCFKKEKLCEIDHFSMIFNYLWILWLINSSIF